MCLHLGKLTNPGEAAKNVFDRLIDYMPLVSLHIACLINQTVVSATSQWRWVCGTFSKPGIHKSRKHFNTSRILISLTFIIAQVSLNMKLKFTLKVEALMFAFHRICRQVRIVLNFICLKPDYTGLGFKIWSFQAPTFLPEDEERLKYFKLRLQVLQANFHK